MKRATYYAVLLPLSKHLASGVHGGPAIYYNQKGAGGLKKVLTKHTVHPLKVIPVSVEWEEAK